jgi:hypothetical protein
MSKTPEEMAADTAAAAAAAAGAAKDGKTSALAAGEEKPEQWIPEKYHKRTEGKKDGPIDLELSMRALASAHGDLTKRMVDVGLPPEDADKYDLTGEEIPKGFDVAQFRKDSKTANFLKGAHSLGMTNKQVNYVIGEYLKTAPELVAAAKSLTAQECVDDLMADWKTDEEYEANIKRCNFAANRLAESAGMKFSDVDAVLGNNPTFIRLMASLASHMGEDVPPLDAGAGGDGEGVNFDDQVKTLQAELAKIPDIDPKGRQALLDKITALFNKRYGTQKQKTVFVSGSTKAA